MRNDVLLRFNDRVHGQPGPHAGKFRLRRQQLNNRQQHPLRNANRHPGHPSLLHLPQAYQKVQTNHRAKYHFANF